MWPNGAGIGAPHAPGGSHEIVPRPGTVRREKDGEPGDLLNALDYPLLADCTVCGCTVRAWHFYADWEHVEA